MGKRRHFKKRRRENYIRSYRREEEHASIHHIVPTSRGGPYVYWNEYRWSRKLHRAWHHLFANFLPSTCISVIKDWEAQDGTLLEYKIGKRNLKSWEVVFGPVIPQDAIRFIEREFMPAEIKFLKTLKGQQ